MSKFSAWLIGGMLLGTMAYAVADDLTLSTYYPSPRGVYNELQTSNDTFLATQGGQIGVGTSTPDSTAVLDLTVQDPTNNPRGFLGPRHTTIQRTNIINPAVGLFIYNTDVNAFEFFNGTSWTQLASGGGALPPGSIGQTMRYDGTNWVASSYLTNTETAVGIGTTTPLSKLDVKGSMVVGSSYAGVFTVSPPESLAVQGYVGIGTTAPAYRLHVRGVGPTDGQLMKAEWQGEPSLTLNQGDLSIGGGELSGSVGIYRIPGGGHFQRYHYDVPSDSLSAYTMTVDSSNPAQWRFYASLPNPLMSSPIPSFTFSGQFGVNRVNVNIDGDLRVFDGQGANPGGDIWVYTLGRGLVLKSPNNKCWRLMMTNVGVPITQEVTGSACF